MSDFTIREALPEESELLTELGIRSKRTWGYSDNLMKTFRNELEISKSEIRAGNVYVIMNHELAIGYYSLLKVEERVAELQHLFVDPMNFGNGFGSKLFNHAIENARSKGYLTLQIQSDPNAAPFYQKHGLEIARQVPSSVPGRSLPVFEVEF